LDQSPAKIVAPAQFHSEDCSKFKICGELLDYDRANNDAAWLPAAHHSAAFRKGPGIGLTVLFKRVN